jgi:GNAT superfamily N-acetyltransferase
MDVQYRINPSVTNPELDELYSAAWPNHQPPFDFTPELRHSLVYVCAYSGEQLVGFVRLAWDGGIHAFVLEPTVHPDFQRQGIGRTLLATAADAARDRGMHWVHVDFEPHLRDFYRACGFTPTDAGLIRLRP